VKTSTQWCWEEVLHFTKKEIQELTRPFEHTLMGKFSFGQSMLMAILKTIQNSLSHEANAYPSTLNHHYVLI
jgi:hypothetical protein